MRVLLDESMPLRFGALLPGHDVQTVQQIGWARSRDGDLLQRAPEFGFQALLTMDRGIPYQQNVARAALGVIIFVAPTNRLVDREPLAPGVRAALNRLRPGLIVYVPGEPPRRRPSER
jgi:hypothetical protein